MTDQRTKDEAASVMLGALKRMHRAFNATKPIPRHEGDALEAMCVKVIAAAEAAGIRAKEGE